MDQLIVWWQLDEKRWEGKETERGRRINEEEEEEREVGAVSLRG
jgi:hypothetical protein